MEIAKFWISNFEKVSKKRNFKHFFLLTTRNPAGPLDYGNFCLSQSDRTIWPETTCAA